MLHLLVDSIMPPLSPSPPQKKSRKVWSNQKLCILLQRNRKVAQLVAHYVRDVGVGRSSRLFPTELEQSSRIAPVFCAQRCAGCGAVCAACARKKCKRESYLLSLALSFTLSCTLSFTLSRTLSVALSRTLSFALSRVLSLAHSSGLMPVNLWKLR